MYTETSKRKLENFVLTYGFYILFFLVCVLFSVLSSAFFDLENLVLILSGSCFLLLAAGGVTPVFVSGNMDMSVGSVALVSVAVMALSAQAGVSMPLCLLLAMLTGMVIGLLNGLLIAFGRLNPMLTTLGLMIAYRGLGLQISGGRTIDLPQQFKALASIRVFGIPIQIVVSLLLMALLQLVLRKTKFGAYCYAIGCNEQSAGKLGIPIKRVKVAVYVISGLFAALTGMIISTKLGLIRNTIGKDMEFTVVAAVVIGGTSLLGGKGQILPGTLLGVLLLYVIDNGLAGMGASPYIYPFVQGIIIFAAMYMDSLGSLRRKF